METTELKVDGMTCRSCVASVTQALKRVPGVANVEVDLARGTARVIAEGVAQQVPAMVAALAAAGFEASAAQGAIAAAVHAPHAQPASVCGQGGPAKGRSGCCCH